MSILDETRDALRDYARYASVSTSVFVAADTPLEIVAGRVSGPGWSMQSNQAGALTRLAAALAEAEEKRAAQDVSTGRAL